MKAEKEEEETVRTQCMEIEGSVSMSKNMLLLNISMQRSIILSNKKHFHFQSAIYRIMSLLYMYMYIF